MTTTTKTPANLDTLIAFLVLEGGHVITKHGYLSFSRRELLAELTAAGVLDEGFARGIIAATEHGFRLCPKVGMGATVRGWSDRDPYEVIAVSPSGKQVTLRAMKAERDPTWQPEWVAGGFAGTVVNQNEQRWIIESDPNGEVIKVNLRKDGQYHHGASPVSMGRAYRFYDYNF